MERHFFDIGANEGNTFDYYLLKSPQLYGSTVWCFEPSPKNLIFLLRKAQNVCDKFNVVVCPFGVSGAVGIGKLTEMVNNTQSDSFYVDVGGTPDPTPKYTIASAMMPISELLRNFTKEDDEVILKVDCEGSEYDIYEDLLNHPELLGRIKTIYNEWHPGWEKMDEVRKSRAAKIIYEFAKYNKHLLDWEF